MEIKARLNKPYTEEQRIDFIVKNNHQQGYEIRETETALEAWGYTDEELEQQEKERIARFNLTGADVERAIYKAKGMDFEDIIEYLMVNPLDGLDVKALKIELKANNFYRGNPLIDVVGLALGITPEQLDKFFEFNDYTYLITDSETPSDEVEGGVAEDITTP